ncbi:Chitin bind 4 domain containing protein [Asbolus verrucosus]|uniref:Chitin bind 4 domain containing protein n=1 Tax=Asbolus verrucosus TaxID=1661398 RepID=A0A482V9I9_ASBVE|nr:Chitin bind 4 domain containing protein [Asbolus verrucosus]
MAFVSALFFHLAATQFNPTILQDSRDLPRTDGTFGFLYRTEDGIAHAAKGDSNGVIHGRFSYTDPTGLKVNYNYNAGSRVAPGYNYDDAPAPRPPQKQYQQPQKQYQQPQPAREEYEEPEQYREPPVEYERPQYVQPQPKYVPRTRPPARPQQRRTQVYSAQYRESEENYQQQRRTRPAPRANNEVFDSYN